ncbi:eaeB [Salmonella enterica subsp. salamae]|uniref:EaeB n=1 Tax=Salmonella enterica TaxID=28901 RepID=A0A402XGF2_SALER|nr:eaeB [Salmonella enterica]ECD9440444.1 eaeB [Salmonella enterica subsp. salamae]EDV1135018.1 eaeB [Salmonella enterica subsp. enterica]AXC81892.1 eaeB [Salmonella enterica subsp. salamae serovar 56:z10:e,n,x]EAY9565638.1 eaeB [Salmonella enterica]EBP0096399.1 eaeB [Salmonella enterica]
MLNAIDTTPLQLVQATPVTKGKTEETTTNSTTSNPAFLTNGRLDIGKLLLEIQKLLRKMLSTLQDYMQKQLGQSYKIQQAAFESQDKMIEEKRSAAQAQLIGGSISSALGILGSFAAINQGLSESGKAAGQAAKEAADAATKASTKALESTTDTLTKTLTKTADSIADSVTEGIESTTKTISKALNNTTSDITEGLTDAMQRTSQVTARNVDVISDVASEAEKSIGIGARFMNGAEKVTKSTPFIAITSLAEGVKTLPMTISDSIKSTHEISEQQHKNVENLQQSNLDLYRQDMRRSQDDIASRQTDITSVTREFLEVQNRMGQSSRGAG